MAPPSPLSARHTRTPGRSHRGRGRRSRPGSRRAHTKTHRGGGSASLARPPVPSLPLSARGRAPGSSGFCNPFPCLGITHPPDLQPPGVAGVLCLGSCRWTAPTCAFKEAGTYKLDVKTEPPQQPSTYTNERERLRERDKVAPPGEMLGRCRRRAVRLRRAGICLKLFPLVLLLLLPPPFLAPSPWMLALPPGFRASLPAQQPPPCPGHRRSPHTGGPRRRGAGAGAGGTEVFLLVVVMEMMLPAAAAAGSLQRR